MRRRAAQTLAAGLLLLLGGCVRTYEVRAAGIEAQAPYRQAVESHSATGKVFADLVPRFEAGVTFETPEFKDALRRELARLQSRAPGEVEVDPRPSVVFFLESPHTAEEDITRHEPTFWVGIEAGDGRWEAAEVERLDVTVPTTRHLFPYVTPFGRAYRLVLPESAVLARGRSVLVVSGAPGELRLAFE